MSVIQGVEVFNPKDDESFIQGQISKDKALEIGAVITRKVVATGLRIPQFKYLPLGSILEKVDDYFDTISHSIGGTTVKHSWVLIPTNLSFWELEQIGISRHMLGSRVQNIQGNKINYTENTNLYNFLSSKLQESSQEFLDKNGWYIADATRPRQFLLGDSAFARPVLVDIEPRIETHTYPPPGHDLL